MSQGSGDTINVTRSRAVSGSFGGLGGRSRGEERQYDLATWRGQERSLMKRGWIWRYGRANRIWVIKARLVKVGSGGQGYGTRGDGAMRRERCRADRAGGQGG